MLNATWLTRLAFALVSVLLALAMGYWLAILQRPLTSHAVAQQLLQQGRADQAAHVFDSALWRGVAHYRAGRLRRSIAAFAEQPEVIAQYNAAGALARIERYDEAIDLYRQVLVVEPNHADARYNLKLVRAALKATEEQSEDNPSAPTPPSEDSIIQASRDASEAITQTITDDRVESPPASAEQTAGAQGRAERESSDTPTAVSGQSDSSADIAPPATSDASAGGQMHNPQQRRIENAQGKALGAAPLAEREEQMAEQITLRQIVDDPALVLRARLRTIYQTRLEARR